MRPLVNNKFLLEMFDLVHTIYIHNLLHYQNLASNGSFIISFQRLASKLGGSQKPDYKCAHFHGVTDKYMSWNVLL